MLAYDYPILGLFWTMFMIFIWVAWLILVFRVFADIFRSDDLGGVAKAGWAIFVLIVPLIGVLVYLLARGDSMTRRDVAAAKASEDAFRNYVRDAAGGGGGGTADELEKLAALKERGVIDDSEFAAQKAKLLA